MTDDRTQRSVLLIGKSRRVLDDAAAGLRARGHKADAINDFGEVMPDLVPSSASFATVHIDAATYTFSIATERLGTDAR